jgi:hypothetical protein
VASAIAVQNNLPETLPDASENARSARLKLLNLLTTDASDLAKDGRTILPLPKGEGRGEGEGDLLTPVEVVLPKCGQMVLPLFREMEAAAAKWILI